MNIFLDVAISMAFIFLLFSIIVSGGVELWQMITRRRSHFLRAAIDDVFNDRLNKNYAHLLYLHPLIDRLKEKKSTYPHYIPSGVFADALIDVIRQDGKLPKLQFDQQTKEFNVLIPPYSGDVVDPSNNHVLLGTGIVTDFAASTELMKESDLKQLLRTMLMGVENYNQLKQSIMKWYDDYMGATSTWYKRSITKMLFIGGFIAAVTFNIDAISLAQDFYRDKLLRDQVVSAAIAYVADAANKPAPVSSVNYKTDSVLPPMDSVLKSNTRAIESAYKDVGMLDIPIGWSVEEVVGAKNYLSFTIKKSRWEKVLPFLWELFKYIAKALLGWLITAAALSYGADNWFNLLIRFINIRSATKPKDETK